MKWIVNLSNGETRIEGEPTPGERLPWQRLLDYCRKNNVKITGLRLVGDNLDIHAMPPKMCDGYFHAYEASKMMFRETENLKQGIGSVVGDLVYITWVSINPSDYTYHVHQEIRPLSEVKIHTTID